MAVARAPRKRVVRAKVEVEDPKQLLAEAKKVQEEAVKAEDLARRAKENAKAQAEKAREAMDKILEPIRAQVNLIQAETVVQEGKVIEAVAKAKAEKKALVDMKAKLEAEYKKAEDLGIPRALVGARRRRRDVPRAAGAAHPNGRVTMKPPMLGRFGPIKVTATRRHGDAVREASIVIEGNGEVFKAKRFGGIIAGGNYTAESTRLSEVTAAPGWLESKDVAYAILHHLNRTDEYPALHPVSDAATIKVNDVPLREAEYKFEVVEEYEIL